MKWQKIGFILILPIIVIFMIGWYDSNCCKDIIALPYSKTPGYAASQYLACFGGDESANSGYVMTYNGSVIALSACLNATIVTTPGDIKICIYRNGAEVFSTTQAIAAVTWYRIYAVQDHNIDLFVASDIIQMYVEFVTFVGTLANTTGMVELQLNIY